ncbi:S66 family peptidase [Actinomycetospora cinnamomea]|uniref:Muramoyltetrapeptide carboxypeptidase LdcA involved in peptidoglycan recycling n=1 Tax=Actinomycetospora cinnamomea TaxID=663609 RepID=A0A2U1FLL0_9PSEU|nr:S66 peptidase family protein [Actinomycetospora cinnamomea]PVZ13093.1 muramoyltetrapeptide carboxypeptidase LdcA involved in peptidoglycan recycling [Actinomycetospora cinnamomea]
MFTYPEKLQPGDRVAVLSPSAGLPAVFPGPFELGLRRLRDEFGLVPVEYPTTRVLGATPQQRAADLHAAFADPEVAAVLVSIGGDDQLKLLRHLDTALLAKHVKPFVGYSDATNLLHFLWNLGIVGYHGGVVMVQWGRGGMMHPATSESLRRALFTRGVHELRSPQEYTDVDRDWADPAALETEPESMPASPWSWHGPARTVSGPGWGGSLEIVDFHLRVGHYLARAEAYDDGVLFLESSEEMPPAAYVYRVLMCMGERGLLQRFGAVLMGRPKAWSFERPNGPRARAEYVDAQHGAVLRALGEYHPDALVVLDVDLGHTDPQLVVPHGGTITVDGAARRITVEY